MHDFKNNVFLSSFICNFNYLNKVNNLHLILFTFHNYVLIN